MDTGKSQTQIELREPLTVLAFLCAGLWALLRQFEVSGVGWLAAGAWATLCLGAILAQSAPASREFVAGTLRKKNFTQIYTFLAKPALRWIWDSLCDQVADGAGPWATFKAALTWKLYDRALLIAVAYPMLLLVGWWIVTGQDGRLGTTVLIHAAPLWPDRILTFGAIAMVVLSVPARKWAADRPSFFLRKLSSWLPLIALALALMGAVALAFEGAIGVEVAFAFWVLLAFSIATTQFQFAGALALAFASVPAVLAVFAFTFADAFIFAGALASFLAGVLAFLSVTVGMYLDGKNRQCAARFFLSLLIPAVWIGVLQFQLWNDAPDWYRGIFLFLGVLPLINALFDVLSYAVTLTLMRLGLTSKQPMIFGALDLLAALFLFLGLGATLTVVIATMNRIAGVQIFDMGALFTGIYSDPHAYWWLYAMVFSTILPTALHGILSLLGAQAIVPVKIRRPVAALLRDAPGTPWKSAIAPLAVGTLWLIPFLALGTIGWLFWRVAGRVVEWLGWQYFTALRDLALWIGAF